MEWPIAKNYRYEPVHNGETFETQGGYVGANFLTGVDTYRRVNRTIKYCFIIIFLTFAGVLAVEITSKRTLNMLFYTLVGSGLVIFYTLLLAISEIIGFGWGYLIASFMTIGLITSFILAILKSRKIAVMICAMLSFMYVFCFIMLSLSSYALLMGSLLLFSVLAMAMYLYYKSYSCRID